MPEKISINGVDITAAVEKKFAPDEKITLPSGRIVEIRCGDADGDEVAEALMLVPVVRFDPKTGQADPRELAAHTWRLGLALLSLRVRADGRALSFVEIRAMKINDIQRLLEATGVNSPTTPPPPTSPPLSDSDSQSRN